MKRILLLRHAKAVPIARGLIDFDRGLTEQGSDDAKLVGEHLQSRQTQVDLVISSPANRARETAGLVIWSAGLTVDVIYDRRIYEADPQMLLDIVSELDPRRNSVLLVGHNPAMEDFLRGLTGKDEKMATASLAHVQSDVEAWAEVGPGNCVLKSFINARDLPME
jgi:phosphohistidine phosphatase